MKDILEKIAKSNEQRCIMALTLVKVMESEKVNINLRSSIAASLIDMLDNHMIEEDKQLIKILNEGIDNVCDDAQKKYGIKDLRVELRKTIQISKQQIQEHYNRVNEGQNILNQINLN